MAPRVSAPSPSDLVAIYDCFCDETRLRILNLLLRGPMCVCHLQEIVGLPQVKISRHLAYLRERKLVHAERFQNWMIYALPAVQKPELEANLRCLQDCAQTHAIFKGDLKRRVALSAEIARVCGAIARSQNFTRTSHEKTCC